MRQIGEGESSEISYSAADENQLEPRDNQQFYNYLLYDKLDLECNFKETFDFFDDVRKLEELLDIRESSAYRVYSILTDNSLQLGQNLYKALSKEERRSLRLSVGVQVSLLLRKIIEKSVNEFADFFGQIKTLDDMEEELSYLKPGNSRPSLDVDVKDQKDSSKDPLKLSKNVSLNTKKGGAGDVPKSRGDLGRKNALSLAALEKMQLQKPEFMHYQTNLFPVLRIDMVFEEGALRFRETEDYIKNEIGAMFSGVVEALDGLLHPEYTKIEVRNQIQGMHDDKKESGRPSTVQQSKYLISI